MSSSSSSSPSESDEDSSSSSSSSTVGIIGCVLFGDGIGGVDDDASLDIAAARLAFTIALAAALAFFAPRSLPRTRAMSRPNDTIAISMASRRGLSPPQYLNVGGAVVGVASVTIVRRKFLLTTRRAVVEKLSRWWSLRVWWPWRWIILNQTKIIIFQIHQRIITKQQITLRENSSLQQCR